MVHRRGEGAEMVEPGPSRPTEPANSPHKGHIMNPREHDILEQIEMGFSHDDAEFAELIANGPRLSGRYKVGLSAAIAVGIGLVLMFPVHLSFGVAGYLFLVAAGTHALRRRPLRTFNESPLQFFHRITAGLFANTSPAVESSLD